MKWIIITCCLFFLFACSNEETVPAATEIYTLKELGTIGTVEYTFSKIVQLNDNQDWYRFGDRKILISVLAKAKAGVDLSKVTADDIELSSTDQSATLLLPAPEIISFDLQPNDIKVELTDVNGLRFEFTQEEKIKVLKLGESSIQQEMKNSNILADAKKNTVLLLTDIYQQMGYKHVTIHFKNELK